MVKQQNASRPEAVTRVRHWSGGEARRARRRRGSALHQPETPGRTRSHPIATDRALSLLSFGLALLLGLGVLLLPAADHRGEALAWTLPGRTPPSTASRSGRERPAAPAAAATVQEVAPPAAVQQLNELLTRRQPRISILEPADGALLADAPWTLRLRVEDWPLVDAGPLGLGPHLLVQIDDAPPIRLLETSLTLPALAPGSHRLTVMAARPWGEVVKRPGSFQQIRLHRVAPNPLSLPAPGTPQLLATAPLEASPGEPLLLDWLLIDAPLQNLRADDARWRLRVSVNGDSFLVEQATPLWLKGWKRGANALQLELVDGRGEPLNPPFNSLVREVRLDSAAPRPSWLSGRLSEADLARLLGQEPAEPAPSTAPPAEPEASVGAASTPSLDLAAPAAEAPAAEEPPAAPVQQDPQPPAPKQEEPQIPQAPPPSGPQPAAPETAPVAPLGQSEPSDEGMPALDAGAAAARAPISPAEASPTGRSKNEPEPAVPAPSAASAAPASPAAAGNPADAAPNPDPTNPGSQADEAASASDAASSAGITSTPEATAAQPESPRLPAARDEVNPDGTLIRPQRSGPLQALRERLQR